MKTYAFVFARGGSKGLSGKNMLPLCGKPLLVHAIEVANAVPGIDGCFVSTDDPEIADVARESGASVIDRPGELAGDATPEWSAWQHAIEVVQAEYGPFERFASLPATSPLRSCVDVTACLRALDDHTDMVVTVTESQRSPWFNMVRMDDDGAVTLLAGERASIARRQDVPKAFDLTTVAYVSRPAFVLANKGLWDGRVRAVRVPRERAVDIDTYLDFKIAECLLVQGEDNGGQ